MRNIAILASALLFLGCSTSGRSIEPQATDEPEDDDSVPDEAEPQVEEPDECASIDEQAVFVRRPVDILFVIDNSTSMEQEIAAIEQRIDGDLARIVQESGIDYRVIMISLYGDSSEDLGAYPVCIAAPLGGGKCAGEGAPLVEGERFFHYSSQVGSLDAGCLLLDGFAAPDSARNGADPLSGEPWQPRAPDGYQKWLRKDAFKSIVIVGDDNLYCATAGAPDEMFTDVHTEELVSSPLHAADLDERLRALSPEQFGTREERRYKIHGIVGLAADHALSASEPIVDTKCATAASDSWGYQELSILTGGLRYPVCRHDSYDEIFHAVAMDAIQTSGLSCDWAIPAPSGGAIDPGLVNLEYTPSGQAKATIPHVPSASDCAGIADGRGWYYDDAARIHSCPRLCDALKADPSGNVHIAFGCETVELL